MENSWIFVRIGLPTIYVFLLSMNIKPTGADFVALDFMPEMPSLTHSYEFNIRPSVQMPTAEFTNSPQSLNNVTMDPVVIQSSCSAFINAFSESAANFTRCSIQNARPLRICTSCVEQYIRATTHFDIIMKGFTVDEEGALCGNMIVNADRIQVVGRTSVFIQKLWSDCSCANCYAQYHAENSTVYWEAANDTLTFGSMMSVTMECFRNNTQSFIKPFFKNISSNSTVCSNCLGHYQRLNLFYAKLQEKYNNLVCVDIVDLMNTTRLLWSKDFLCFRQKYEVGSVIVLSLFLCLLPAAAYISSRLHARRRKRKIIKQKRLQEVTEAETSQTIEDHSAQ